MTAPVLHRLWAKSSISETGCWEFNGCRLSCGYGRILWNGRLWLTHRVTYTLLVGPIPEDLEIDHLCKNKPCCNPDHLEAVTRSENIRRGTQADHFKAAAALITHCPLGHPYDETNTYYTPQGSRQCRQCKPLAMERYLAKPGIRHRRAVYARAYRAARKQSQLQRTEP